MPKLEVQLAHARDHQLIRKVLRLEEVRARVKRATHIEIVLLQIFDGLLRFEQGKPLIRVDLAGLSNHFAELAVDRLQRSVELRLEK